ncbi:MAG TPA: cellulase family glycosylhydrolase [bacterium]|nr:cellulase family glycosylhydrolase [bacterium]
MKRPILTVLFLALSSTALWAAPDELQVVGNRLRSISQGCTVRLKGVNTDSLEFTTAGQGPAGGITAVVANAVTQWGSNVIRLPLSQDFWFGCTNSKVGGNPVNGPNYRALVDSIVNYCSSQNAYVILDLHWSGSQTGATAPCGTGWGNATAQRYMPDDNSVTFWSSVASTYANNPAVLFDLFNEPYDYDGNGWNIWQAGGTGISYGYHTPGMQALLNTVRATGANNIVVMGGLDYAYDLSNVDSYPMTNVGNGIVYATHIYPFKGSNPWTTNDGDNKITVASSTHPILIGEFGQGNSISGYTPNPDTNGSWDQALMTWADLHGYNATAWDMHYNSCPCLLQSDWTTATTFHGVPVKNWLATPAPPCLTATPTVTPTATETPCGYPGNTCTPTDTPTPSDTPTPTDTPQAPFLPWPNPWDGTGPLNLNYQNVNGVDQVKLKVYTLAFRKVFEDDNLVITPGTWNYQLDWNNAHLNLANGLYYFVLTWKNGGKETRRVMKVILRR